MSRKKPENARVAAVTPTAALTTAPAEAAAVVATVVAAAVVLAAVAATVAAVAVVAAVGVRVRRKAAVIAEIPELPKSLDCDLGRWRYD